MSASPTKPQEPEALARDNQKPEAVVPEATPAQTQLQLPELPVASTATLLLSCGDQKGVIAAVAQLLFGFQCNITSSDQFSDQEANMFFQRVVFDYSDCIVGQPNIGVLERAIGDLAKRFDMTWTISYKRKLKRAAILVSKQDHCLWDLLIRTQGKELDLDIPLVISNHPDLESIAKQFQVPFVHLPGTKAQQEEKIEALIAEHQIDFVILARYMQIFSTGFCDRNWRRTINIHHSFLPAFEGARPYHRAHERGVKIIGATAHFATAELDAGPIIGQDITRITHRDTVEDMVRKGKDLERLVLSRAVRSFVEDRVIVHGNKTIIFE